MSAHAGRRAVTVAEAVADVAVIAKILFLQRSVRMKL
jgi:hypothetical protein